MNFISTSDIKTVKNLQKLGFELLYQNGEIYTFKNHPTLQFELQNQKDLKIVKNNMLCI